jgi:hypothetical protein
MTAPEQGLYYLTLQMKKLRHREAKSHLTANEERLSSRDPGRFVSCSVTLGDMGEVFELSLSGYTPLSVSHSI